MGLINEILARGNDSLLYQELVKKRGLTGGVSAGINIGLGNMFSYDGPMLYTVNLFYDDTAKTDTILSAIDGVIANLQEKPVERAALDRALTKFRSSFYDSLASLSGFGTADLLASLALFDDNPARINTLEGEFRKVTPELIQKTAREFLRPGNRTILVIEPGASTAKPGAAQ
jgi:zinc protease